MTEEQIKANHDESMILWQKSAKAYVDKLRSQIEFDEKILAIDKENLANNVEWYLKCCAESGLTP